MSDNGGNPQDAILSEERVREIVREELARDDSGDEDIQRRSLLKMGGVLAAATTLSGCTNGSSDNQQEQQQPLERSNTVTRAGRDEQPDQSQYFMTSENDLLQLKYHDGIELAELLLLNLQEDLQSRTDRRIASDSPIEIYVDPDGDDDADGSEGNPVATLQEAFNRLPIHLRHRTRIHLNEGVHKNDQSAVTSTRHVVNILRGDDFQIVGDPDNPGDYVVGAPGPDAGPNWLNLSFLGSPPITTVLAKGITFNCKCSIYGGMFGFSNCILNSSEPPGVRSCIGGYGGRTVVQECKIGDRKKNGTDPVADHVCSTAQMAWISFNNNVGEVNESIIHSREHGGIVFDGGGNDIDAPKWSNDGSNQTNLTVRGNTEIGENVPDDELWR